MPPPTCACSCSSAAPSRRPASAPASYSDAKVANRNLEVWHGATDAARHGTAQKKMALE
jgi:hypothetical protein